MAALLLTGCGTSHAFLERVEVGYASIPYQQEFLNPVDPGGDARLFRNLDTISVKLYTYLFESTLPQTDSLRERKRADRERVKQDGEIPFRIGKTMPINIDRLLNRCGEILRKYETAIVPIMGEEHKWSPEARKYLRYGFWHRLHRHAEYKQLDFPLPLLMRSKLLLCLACGWTARYCVTGQEAALAETPGHPPRLRRRLPRHPLPRRKGIASKELLVSLLTKKVYLWGTTLKNNLP